MFYKQYTISGIEIQEKLRTSIFYHSYLNSYSWMKEIRVDININNPLTLYHRF